VNAEHSYHCRACKERVRELLAATYGDCRVGHQFPWSAQPKDYAATPIGDLLERICAGLGDCRGHRDYIQSPQMPPCDFYVVDPPFILEFDESQHFSRPRLATLSFYPDDIKMGFSVTRWQELCREIDAKDDQPFDRDERRAWYDTLRDLVPSVHGFRPTVRLYAGEYPWCSFHAASDPDLDIFRNLLADRLPRRLRKSFS
jgi:hypothetical protein